MKAQQCLLAASRLGSIEVEWDDIINEWSYDSTKSSGDDHTDSKVYDVTAEQEIFKIL